MTLFEYRDSRLKIETTRALFIVREKKVMVSVKSKNNMFNEQTS